MSDLKTALKAELSAINKVTNLVAKLPPASQVKVLEYVLKDAQAKHAAPPAEPATKG